MLLALVLTAIPVCRYTVRDIGFVDLVGAEYALSHGGPKDAGLTLEGRALLGVLVRDANVVLGQPEPGASGWWLAREGSEPLDLVIDGRDDAAARAAWEAAVRSPLRDRILAEALTSFATLLRVRGTDAAEEARIDGVLAAAREGLQVLSATLPRPVDRPLVTAELTSDARETERVVLWALGLTDESQAAVAIVYGRGKLAGSVMVGPTVTLEETLAQLALVGESCECDTSRDWFNELRLPMPWTDRQRARAASELGFDPESPMVKSEVVRILERGPLAGGAPRQGAPDGIDALVFGYREMQLEGGTTPAPHRDFEADGGAPSAGAGLNLIDASEGDDWGFEDEPAAHPAPAAEEPPAEEPAATGLSMSPYMLVLGGGVLALLGLLAWLVTAALEGRRRA